MEERRGTADSASVQVPFFNKSPVSPFLVPMGWETNDPISCPIFCLGVGSY